MTRAWDEISRRPWRRLRAKVLRQEPLCVFCDAAGRVTLATEVDHIVAISEGGELLDETNLQPLCHNCHTEKHGGRPRVAIDPETGLPLPGEHHWWSEPE